MGKQKTTKEVLLANKKMGVFPVAMSLLASFISAISLLGYPAEIYAFGTMLFWYAFMYFIAYPLAAYLFIPVFFNLELTSGYKYLELRFDNKVRLIASFTFCLQILLYMAVVLYAPALALSSVTELSMVASILVTGILATFYTTIGGAKAVIYTNTVQMIFILIGLLAVVIGGCIFHGGIENVWKIAYEGDRIHFDDFRIDPTVRHSAFSLVIGGTFTLLTLFAANQMSIQRYISMKTLRQAQIALLLNVPFNIVSIVLYTLAGLILYSTYAGCDPVKTGKITKNDQLLPYFVMDKLGVVFGLPGLFVSALYGAGLSTLSGGFNAVSAVVLEDFVKPAYHWKSARQLNDRTAATISKILAFVMGAFTIGMAFLFTLLKSTVLQIALSIFGMVGGPLLGAFILGMFFPWANKYGALCGQLVSLFFTFWIELGAIANKIAPVPLSVETSCNSSTTLFDGNNLTVRVSDTDRFGRVMPANADSISSGLTALYSISYQYYSLIEVIILVTVGMAVSALTGFSDPKKIDPKLLIPVYRKLLCCCPKSFRDTAKCGVNFAGVKPIDTSAALINPEDSQPEIALKRIEKETAEGLLDENGEDDVKNKRSLEEEEAATFLPSGDRQQFY